MRPPFTFGLIAAGGSNLTYRVDDADGRKLILRRPPAAAVLASAHDVAREHRIMAALRDTDVPVPEMLAFCGDAAVTGAPFYVMSYAEGLILRRQATAAEIGADNCGRAAVAFFETLARIHTLDTTRAGLDDLSRAGGYVERQLRRWLAQYHGLAAGATRIRWCSNCTTAWRPNLRPDISKQGLLVHGDYHIDNAVLDPDMSVVAVLDWELATLGHPIADLCWALMFWARPGDPMVMMEEAVTAAPGFPGRSEMAGVYEKASGYPSGQSSLFSGLRIVEAQLPDPGEPLPGRRGRERRPAAWSGGGPLPYPGPYPGHAGAGQRLRQRGRYLSARLGQLFREFHRPTCRRARLP